MAGATDPPPSAAAMRGADDGKAFSGGSTGWPATMRWQDDIYAREG